jgi:hypothetical protein
VPLIALHAPVAAPTIILGSAASITQWREGSTAPGFESSDAPSLSEGSPASSRSSSLATPLYVGGIIGSSGKRSRKRVRSKTSWIATWEETN